MGNQTAASESGDTWPTDAKSKPRNRNRRFRELDFIIIYNFWKRIFPQQWIYLSLAEIYMLFSRTFKIVLRHSKLLDETFHDYTLKVQGWYVSKLFNEGFCSIMPEPFLKGFFWPFVRSERWTNGPPIRVFFDGFWWLVEGWEISSANCDGRTIFFWTCGNYRRNPNVS